MRTWFPAAARVVAASGVLVFSPAGAGTMAITPHANIDQGKGDWRRHEIVRTWRDEGGCRLSVVTYHRPNGEVDHLQNRDCGKD